jgi:choline dehydrogenase
LVFVFASNFVCTTRDEEKKMRKSELLKNNEYGSLTNLDSYDQLELEESISSPGILSRRWSVLDKFDRRYHGRVKSFDDCYRIFNFKFFLAILMLIAFIWLAFAFIQSVLFLAVTTPNTFDFIVIGGGTAGAVVTKQLIDSGAKVLLIEAGNATQFDLGGANFIDGPVSRFDIPLVWSSLWQFNDFTWNDIENENILLAKGLGGCGVQNAMIYMRALSNDITQWNLEKWNWNKFLDKYKSFEKFTIQKNNDLNSSQLSSNSFIHHGNRGPITVTELPITKLSETFILSAQKYGLNFTNDFNDPEKSRLGVGNYHFTVENGVRSSIARGMLSPLISNSNNINNFYIELNAVVRKIILQKKIITNTENKPINQQQQQQQNKNKYKAIGIEYIKNSQIKIAYLKNYFDTNSQTKKTKKSKLFDNHRSVILTAGAIMTPKILFNSGIGPKNVLKNANVEVLVENNFVGKNLQDHFSVGLVYSTDDSINKGFGLLYVFICFYIVELV